MIATNGTTTLARVGNLFELNPAGGGTGPLLELNGSVVTAGQFPAGWTPVGAEQTATGYEVALSAPVPGQSGQNQYVVWNTDSNGDYTSVATGILSGTSPALEAIEANFGETFPGAGPPASPGAPASTTVAGTNAATTLEIGSTVSNNQTVDFADLPSGGPSAVDLIDPNGFSGKIENFASPDTVNLSGDWVFLRFSENPAATLGTLTLAERRQSCRSLAQVRRRLRAEQFRHHPGNDDHDDRAHVKFPSREAIRRLQPDRGLSQETLRRPSSRCGDPRVKPIGANISGPCIGRCVFFLEARADVGPAPPTRPRRQARVGSGMIACRREATSWRNRRQAVWAGQAACAKPSAQRGESSSSSTSGSSRRMIKRWASR